MSKKKALNAQTAKENTPTKQASSFQQESETAIDANNGKSRAPDETNVQPEPKPLTTSERIALIEQQLAQADKNFQQIGTFIERMEPLIKLSTQIQQQQQVAPAPQGSPDVAGLLNSPMIKELLGGGGQNSVLEEYGRQYMDLSGFVVKEVFKNIVPEAVTRMEAAAAARIAAKAPV